MSQIAESYTPPLEHGHLSRIFSGKRYPSIKYARFIADALGMTLQSFLDEIALLHAGELTEGLAQLHANSKITVDGIDA
jgi:transcriptional regulator with XRE-family HTH domain